MFNRNKIKVNMCNGYDPFLENNSGLVLYFDPANSNSFRSSTSSIIYDLSGLNNHGTISSSVSLSGPALPLQSKHISVNHNSSLVMSNSFTQIIWAKFDYELRSSFRVLFGKPDFQNYGLIVEWTGGNFILADFFTSNGRNGMGFYPSLLGWNFIAQSYDASVSGYNHYLYVGYDNKLYIYRISNTGSIQSNISPVMIGDIRFSMSIGRTALYNRALSIDEISKIYYKTKKTYGFSNELVNIYRAGCTLPSNVSYDPIADYTWGCEYAPEY
jgi:hypothetical protein